MSDSEDYIEYTIKKHKTLPANPLIHIYIRRINNRLVFKIKNVYKPELQTNENKKLFDRTKKSINKTNGANVPSLEEVEVVLVQCNLTPTKV